MRYLLAIVAVAACCFTVPTLAQEETNIGQLEDELVPPVIFVAVFCSDPTEPTGQVRYDVDMVNGGIDEPMTWSKPGSGRGRLANAWRLRLGNGETVVTTQPCSYRL